MFSSAPDRPVGTSADLYHDQSEGLRLAPHVHACRSEDQVVLLDLLRDKYFAVGGASAGALAGTVEGWPSNFEGSAMTAALAGANPEALARRLVHSGLLTSERSRDRRLPAVFLPEATTTLGHEEAPAVARVDALHLFWFLRSVAAAALALRMGSLMTVVRLVAARSKRPGARRQRLPLERAHHGVVIYERLRPLIFTSRDKCLFDSLALMNFLAYQKMFPHWVIGVKTGPFGAHSWVQFEGIVLNDLHEHVRKFTPILVV